MFKVRLTKIGKANVPARVRENEEYTVYGISEAGFLIYLGEEYGFEWVEASRFKPIED